MTVTTKQISTIRFQLEFMAMMQNCGRVNEANQSLMKIKTLMEQLFGIDVVLLLRRDLFEANQSINEGHSVCELEIFDLDRVDS
jgi:hypothetical protein